MNVAEFMSRNVISVVQETPILEAARLMIQHSISGLPVIDRNGSVVGIVSERDLLRRRKEDGGVQDQHWLEMMLKYAGHPPRDHGFAERKVADVMTPDPVTVAPASSLDEACRLIEQLGVKRLPVVEDGKLVGIIARSDLVRALTHALTVRPTAGNVGDVSVKQRMDELERRVLRERARALEPF
jgi:CBS domain-containing protein